MAITRKNIQEYAGAAGNNTYVYWGRWGSNATLSAFVAGTTGTVAQGASAGMGRFLSLRSMTWPTPELPNIPVPNEGGTTETVRGEATSSPTGALTYGVLDLDFLAASSNAKIYTVGAYDKVGASLTCQTLYPLFFVVNVPGYSRDSTKPGTGWLVHELLYVTAEPVSDENVTQGNALENIARLTYGHTTILPWGTTITSANTGYNQLWRFHPYFSENPIYYHTGVGDNVVTTFTLDIAPVSDDGDALIAWKNGTLQTYTTHYANSSVTVTPVVKPIANETWVFGVQHAPTC